MTLATKLKSKGLKPQPKRKRPVWDGPESNTPNGGITQSLLAKWINCKERCRLYLVEGLHSQRGFDARMGYGSMWHVCEEALAGKTEWLPSLRDYAREECRKHPMQQDAVDQAYNVCKVQFPIYVEYWSKHKDVKDRTPLMQEQVFNVPYELPSGRTVFLRGKWDAVDLIGKGKNAKVYLQENKTKSDLDEQRIKRQLAFDLQSGIYLTALQQHIEHESSLHGKVLGGVRYNCIRRPLSGGPGSIRRHKATKNKPEETKEEFYARLAEVIKDDIKENKDANTYFARYQVDIIQQDIINFQQQFLTPILEELCAWWGGIENCDYDPWNNKPRHQGIAPRHWRHPHGVYNIVDQGGTHELDEYLATGSELGLEHTTSLFKELE